MFGELVVIPEHSIPRPWKVQQHEMYVKSQKHTRLSIALLAQ